LFMFRTGGRRRIRPGIKSFALSCFVCPAGLYLSTFLPFDSFLEPLSATLVIALAVALFRFGRLRQGLPEPYGRGKTSVYDATAMARSGVLIIIGGAVLMVGVIGSSLLVPTFPPAAYFSMVFGLMAGLPLSEVLFFAEVSMVERSAKGRVFEVAEETEEGDSSVLRKSIEIVPRR
jgi:hypothetical protein